MKNEGGLRLQGVKKKTSANKPLVSVITSVFNGEEFLEKTILNIVNQTYENLEYIVVDGGSTDHTLDILKKYSDRIDYWISEKDQGISDAFNKGVVLAEGDYINFQGDGDGFLEPDSVKKIMEGANPEEDYLIAGRVRRIDLEGKTLYDSPPIRFHKRSLLFRMSLPHQGLFTNIRFFRKYGLFDIKNKFAMDYDHLLRAYHDFPKTKTTDQIVANWRADGVGNGKTLQVFQEYDRLKRLNKVAPSFVLTLINFWIHFKFKVKMALGG